MACRGEGGTKSLQILRKVTIFEVPENKKAIRNAALWGATVTFNATSPIMMSQLLL